MTKLSVFRMQAWAGVFTMMLILQGGCAPAAPTKVKAVAVVKGLNTIWDFAFLPDGRMLITERKGRFTLADPKTGKKTPAGKIDVWAQGEAGLMGMALSPNFSKDSALFACYTKSGPNGPVNRVSRFRLTQGRVSEVRVVLDHLPGGFVHDGCRVRFSPKGELFVTMGDAGNRELAQLPASPSGKVHRILPDGSLPKDNPFSKSSVFTYGHRNPQGLAFHPVTGEPYISEHGENDNDEINRLVKGGNYGWPRVRGTQSVPGFVAAVQAWTPTLAVSGAVFYDADRIPGWRNDLFVASLKAMQIHRIRLKGKDLDQVAGDDLVLSDSLGRIRALGMGPDGFLYAGTSNLDGRGRPSPDGDQIYRLEPMTE